MLKIDPKITCHKVNSMLGVKPIRQKRRSCSQKKKNVTIEEVKRLREAKFVKELKYPIWFYFNFNQYRSSFQEKWKNVHFHRF